MLATMPIFNLDFSSPHRPAHSSPLSSSPIRPSSPPPLGHRDPNTLPRFDTQSLPIRESSTKFKFARNVKPNPLRQNRENAQESRRNLFLRNVRKRADDRAWDRRGGDQETLKLEWSILDRQRREQKNADIDGIVFEDELDDILELQRPQMEQQQDPDEMMVDAMVQEEEEELNAMLSMLETHSSQAHGGTMSSTLVDDDDYDDLFMDFLSQQDQGNQNANQQFASSGQMDMS
ncbi:hypothetical protein F5B19DRAFT_163748 [Rostrohypoxylon terebratum]|nr:hypothetical protein F5B19DRAFT_163748 [Rostrohypoxylon terebratum]